MMKFQNIGFPIYVDYLACFWQQSRLVGLCNLIHLVFTDEVLCPGKNLFQYVLFDYFGYIYYLDVAYI